MKKSKPAACSHESMLRKCVALPFPWQRDTGTGANIQMTVRMGGAFVPGFSG